MKKELKKWKKYCPNCEKEISYVSKKNLLRSIKNNSWCRSCGIIKIKDARSKQIITEEHKSAISKTLTGRKRSKKVCEKIRQANIGKTLSKETKQKISKTKSGIKQTPEQIEARRKGLVGRIHSDKTKQKISNTLQGREFDTLTKNKMRISAIKRISKAEFNGGQVFPNYNSDSIPILEQKAKELEISDLQHAENGGEFYIEELGYWVDGYSKEKNIVIEYYEPFHKHQKEKDLIRKKEITKHLNCKFIIIEE